MKKFLSSKIFFAIVFTLIGVITTVIFYTFLSPHRISDEPNSQEEELDLDRELPPLPSPPPAPAPSHQAPRQDPSKKLKSFIEKFKKRHRQSNKLFDDFFNDDFFRFHDDPFKEMEEMRKRMEDKFKDYHKFFNGKSFDNKFDGWFKNRFGGGNASDIKTREDDKYIYYELLIEGFTEEGLKIDIQNNMVIISGKIKKPEETDDQGIKSHQEYVSDFRRAFPAPQGVDPNNAEIQVRGDTIIIKFPKVKKESQYDI